MGAVFSICNNKWIIGNTLGENYKNENINFLLINCHYIYINTSKRMKGLKHDFIK